MPDFSGHGAVIVPIVLGALFLLLALFMRYVAITGTESIGSRRIDAAHVFSSLPIADTLIACIAGLFVVWSGAIAVCDALSEDSSTVQPLQAGGVTALIFTSALTALLFGLSLLGLWMRADAKRTFDWFVRSSLRVVLGLFASAIVLSFFVLGMFGRNPEWPVVLGLAWAFAVPAIVIILPAWTLSRYEVRGGRRHSRQPLNVDGFRRHLTRNRLVSAAILRENAGVFFVSLPLSMVLGLVPLFDFAVRLPPHAVATTWITASLAWSGVLLNRLFFIEDTFAKAYAADLHRVVQAQRNQLLVLGYSDIGRRFVYEQFNKELPPYNSLEDHAVASHNVVMPTGRIGKIFTRIVVVEEGDPRTKGAVQSPDSLHLTTRDVSGALRDSGDGPPRREPVPFVDYVVPVVVGDPSDPRILQGAGFDDAAFVVCAVEEDDGAATSQAVLQRLKELTDRGRWIPAVMTVHTSMLAPYVTQRVVDHDLELHYIFPEHLEGLNAANVLHAAVLKLRALGKDEWPRIVICGQGKRAFYLVDSFLKNLARDEYVSLAATQQRDPRVLLIGGGDDSETIGLSPTALCATSVASHLTRSGLGFTELPFTRQVARNVVAKGGGLPFEPVSGGPLIVPKVRHEPHDLAMWSKLLDQTFWPDIVVFADPVAENELRAMHALVNTVVRVRGQRPLPLLILSGETGRRYEMREFESALVYYASLHDAKPSDPDSDRYLLFPTPGLERTTPSGLFRGDCLVDVLDDPIQRMSAVLRAYCPRGAGWPAGEERLPLELNFCAADQAGIMATTLAWLGGQRPGPPKFAGEEYPSLSNAKVIHLTDRQFLVRTFAYLSSLPVEDLPAFARLTASGRTAKPEQAGDTWTPPVEWVENLLHLAAGAPKRVTDRRGLRALKDHAAFAKTFAPFAEAMSQHIGQCCGMVNCPVEAMHKIAAASRQTVAGGMIRSDQVRTGHAQRLVQHFSFDDQSYPKRVDLMDAPFASIRLTCKGSDNPGTLASAVNALLFRTLSRVDLDAHQPVFNATYVSAYECHDERYGVFTCYGALDTARPGADATLPTVLQKVEIKAARHPDRWEAYARNLLDFLGEEYTVLQNLDTPRRMRPSSLLGHRILILRKDLATTEHAAS